MATSDYQHLLMEIGTLLPTTNVPELQKLCLEFKLVTEDNVVDKSKMNLVVLLMNFLDTELGIEKNLLAEILNRLKGVKVPVTPKHPVELSAIVPIKREFKISGQIGVEGQKDNLPFTSLIHQIEGGLVKGYTEAEIVEAVIKSVRPSLKLRSYLEGRPALSLASLRRILRSHFHEKSPTELYQVLSSATQGSKETAPDFLVRVFDLRQRVLFASQEADSKIKYDRDLVQLMALHALQTGLSNDNIRSEIKPYLDNIAVPDEILIEKMSSATRQEEERHLKLTSRSRVKVNVAAVEEDDVKPTQPKPKKNTLTDDVAQIKEDLLCVKQLHAEIASIKETLASNGRGSCNAKSRYRGCPACRKADKVSSCRHCWDCGASNHTARDCPDKQQKGNDNRAMGRGQP